MQIPEFSERVQRDLAPLVEQPVHAWIVAAAQVFGCQLRRARGLSHRELADPLCEWLGFSNAEREAVGLSLDLLQISFDLADNLADEQEDRKQGRTQADGYAAIPPASRYCLPAYLVASSREVLERQFGDRPKALREAGRQVHAVLGLMLHGQGITQCAEKAHLVSGAQARLLCLPLWLSHQNPQAQAAQPQVERWAEVWGTSWELGFMHEDQPSAASRAAWLQAVAQARRCWPNFGPFLPGQRLAADALLPGVC